jgi:uncharacterized protein YcbK (DUF882 family)
MLADGKYFKVIEMACHDGTPYPEYYAGRLVEVFSMNDKVREAVGCPLLVISGYRSPAYNQRLSEDSQAHQVASGSQHVQGRAVDLRPTGTVTVQDLYRTVMLLYKHGELPEIGGIGLYPESNWVHLDTFHAEDGHLRQWQGR